MVALGLLFALTAGSTVTSSQAADSGFADVTAMNSNIPSYSLWLDDNYTIGQPLERLPTAWSLASVFENIAQPTVLALEASGGFATPDPNKFSIYGDSWQWNAWFLNGVDYSDAFFTGSPALTVPLFAIDRAQILYRESTQHQLQQGVAFETAINKSTRVAYQSHVGGLGGIMPGGKAIMAFFSSKHAEDRGIAPPDLRRQLVSHYQLEGQSQLEIFAHPLHYAVSAEVGQRQFLDFLEQQPGTAQPFFENFMRSTLYVEHCQKKQRQFFAVEYRQRDHLFAELYHAPNETAEQENVTLLVGANQEVFDVGLSVQSLQLRTQPHFSRDLLDLDGEALWPYIPGGRYVGLHFDLHVRPDPFYLAFNQKMLSFSPAQAFEQHTLHFAGQPAGHLRFAHLSTTRFWGQHRAGHQDMLEFGRGRLHYDLFLNQNFGGNQSGDNTLHFLDFGFNTHLRAQLSQRWLGFFSLSRHPIAPNDQLLRVLDPRYQNGAFVQNGNITQTTGGAFVERAEHIQQPKIYTAALGLRHNFDDVWRFESQALMKHYQSPYQLELKGSKNIYGREQDGAYFFENAPTRYQLSNAKNFDAVYFGGHFQLAAEQREKFVFVLGFSAFNAVAPTSFGNGPMANDLGNLSFFDANPNSQSQALANTDHDRAFMLKTLFGYRFGDLWAFINIAHRDGRPFAFLNATTHDTEQVAVRYNSYRGSPLQYQRPLAGPRTDFRLTVDAKLSYTVQLDAKSQLRIHLLGSNLFDLGSEIAELNTPDGKRERAALELQIPRSLNLGLELVI